MVRVDRLSVDTQNDRDFVISEHRGQRAFPPLSCEKGSLVGLDRAAILLLTLVDPSQEQNYSGDVF